MATRSLSEFRPQRANLNRHTPRGLGMLDAAMAESGYVAPITVAADGEAIDGSARLERAARQFDGVEPIVVEHDGTRPIIAVRTDIPSAGTPAAKRIAAAANRIAEVNLNWDAEGMRALLETDATALDGLFDEDQMAVLLLSDAEVSVHFDAPPPSVEENRQQLDSIRAQRRQQQEQVHAKTDTERYLIVVFPNRAAKATQLRVLGLPEDERYLVSHLIEIRRRAAGAALRNLPKSAPPSKSGATG